MKISLTKIDSYNLEINGVAFKNMRVTGKLVGIMALSNGTSEATLCRTLHHRFSEVFAGIFNVGKDEAWVPIRGTPDIQKAMALKVVEAQPTPKDAPLAWPYLICAHDWGFRYVVSGTVRRQCIYCKKSEEVPA